MEVWEQQIADIAIRANRWLTVSEICAWIGFGMSIIALLWLVVTEVRERKKYGKHI